MTSLGWVAIFPIAGLKPCFVAFVWISSRKRVAIERAVERRSPPDPIQHDSNPTGGRHRPALLVPRGRVLVLRGQGHRGYHRPVGPVLPRRRPDGRRLHPHLRRLPHLRLHHQDPHGTSSSLRNAKIHSLSCFRRFSFLLSSKESRVVKKNSFFSIIHHPLTIAFPSLCDVHRRRSSTKRPRCTKRRKLGPALFA